MQTGKGILALAPDLLKLLADDDFHGSPEAVRVALTPGQAKMVGDLLDGLAAGDVCVLCGALGSGKSTVLRYIAQSQGGVYLSAVDFFALLRDRPPAAIEETFFELLDRAVRADIGCPGVVSLGLRRPDRALPAARKRADQIWLAVAGLDPGIGRAGMDELVHVGLGHVLAGGQGQSQGSDRAASQK